MDAGRVDETINMVFYDMPPFQAGAAATANESASVVETPVAALAAKMRAYQESASVRKETALRKLAAEIVQHACETKPHAWRINDAKIVPYLAAGVCYLAIEVPAIDRIAAESGVSRSRLFNQLLKLDVFDSLRAAGLQLDGSKRADCGRKVAVISVAPPPPPRVPLTDQVENSDAGECCGVAELMARWEKALSHVFCVPH